MSINRQFIPQKYTLRWFKVPRFRYLVLLDIKVLYIVYEEQVISGGPNNFFYLGQMITNKIKKIH